MKIFDSYVNYHKWNNHRYQYKYPTFDDVPCLALYQRNGDIRGIIVNNAELHLFLKEHPGSYDAYPRITGRHNDRYTIKYNLKYGSFEIYCTRFAPCVGSIDAKTGEWVCWNPKIFRNKPLWLWDKLFLKDNNGQIILLSDARKAKALAIDEYIEEHKVEMKEHLKNSSAAKIVCETSKITTIE